MRKTALAQAGLLIMIVLLPLSVSAQASGSLPPACIMEGPEVYMVVNGNRRHIVDWDSFLNLGYKQADIVPCAADANDLEAGLVTRLLKGSDVRVYWMQDGRRRHIPDMDTFEAMGFQIDDITILPDDILAKWRLGAPIDSILSTTADKVYQTVSIASYTICLWHPGQGISDFATISALNQPDIRVDGIESIAPLPVDDINGDGYPDLMFLTHPNGSAHCCYGTIIYSLGKVPTQILNILSPAYQTPGTGRGDFQDIDGDGRYEFVTNDPLGGIACTQPSVNVILQYDPMQGHYVGVTPQFATYRADMIARYLSLPSTSDPCTIYPMVTTLMYLGKTDEAKAAFYRLYHADNTASYWETLQAAVKLGRFYVPAN
ncbi:MAG: hypothetical protein ABI690_28040 [Chloroflexota bacterium]